MKKQYIEVTRSISLSVLSKIWVHLKGAMLSPVYLLLAKKAGVPGLLFHLRVVKIFTFLLIKGKVSFKTWYIYIHFPMDSTRYFEFHEVWERVKYFAFDSYVDISSPRLLPLLLLYSKNEVVAEFINPVASDLHQTEKLAEALKLRARCNFHTDILENIKLPPSSYDLLTCISVLEHIPDDKNAFIKMWSLIRPGGKLILTLPCKSKSEDQYINYNQYGLLNSESNGYTFWQHYYDSERLEASIYSVAGKPTYKVFYGEKEQGLFFRNATMKRLLGDAYPFWRESHMMATEYKIYSSCDMLPGEGVVMLEFIKE